MIRITPHSYHTDPEHKALADQAMAAADLPAKDVREMRLFGGHFIAFVVERDDEGGMQIDPKTSGVVTRAVVRVIQP